MVEFTLPKNSVIGEGKVWPKPEGATNLREFRIYRYNPDSDANPRIDTYFVDTDDCGPMVLDGIIWIKNKIDPTLTFRRSCREGICGSCSMNIDGVNTLACTKGMDEIEGADQTLSAAAYGRGEGPRARSDHLLRAARGDRALAARRRQSGEGAAAVARSIAPSSTGSTSAFSAPAARPPARAIGGTPTAFSAPRRCCRRIAGCRTSRDEATEERLGYVDDTFRLYRCHTIMNCTKVCPKGLSPAKAIAELKNLAIERQRGP